MSGKYISARKKTDPEPAEGRAAIRNSIRMVKAVDYGSQPITLGEL